MKSREMVGNWWKVLQRALNGLLSSRISSGALLKSEECKVAQVV